MGTKLDKVVTYNEEFPLIKSHDFLVTCSDKVTRQFKCVTRFFIRKVFIRKRASKTS